MSITSPQTEEAALAASILCQKINRRVSWDVQTDGLISRAFLPSGHMRKNRIFVKDGIQEKKKIHLLASTIAEGQQSEHGKEVGVSSEEVPPFCIAVDICITALLSFFV